LRFIRKRRNHIESDEEKIKEEPMKKRAKKAKASKSAAPDIQEEVAELEPVRVLEKRTRCGTS